MRISSSCYAITGLYFLPPWGVNSGFIVGRDKTLVIDTGANNISAQTIFGYASSVKENNPIIAINTEKHLDHMGGNSFFFDKGIEVYGHSQILRGEKEIDDLVNDFRSVIPNPIRRENNEAAILFQNTRIANPNKKVIEEIEIDLGNFKAMVLTTPGHTTTNISVYLPSEGVLYCGDCIVNCFIPNLEEGTLEEWAIWEKSLRKIEKLSPEIVVPGHGNVLFGNEVILSEINRIRAIINDAIKTGIAPTQK